MHVLLLGAGFSRNWGGWLASELVGELSGLLADRPWLCEMLRVYRCFERAYAERFEAAQSARNDRLAAEDVVRLQHAILEVFTTMNAGFARKPGMEFSSAAEKSLVSFLARFDAIFTLNQDLLLEAHYRGIENLDHGRWPNGCAYPGIAATDEWLGASASERVRTIRNVAASVDLDGQVQPIFKLHGSGCGTGKRDADVPGQPRWTGRPVERPHSVEQDTDHRRIDPRTVQHVRRWGRPVFPKLHAIPVGVISRPQRCIERNFFARRLPKLHLPTNLRLLSAMRLYTRHEDVEALLKRENRASLPLRRLVFLYLDPFSLFKDASSGTALVRQSALSYNRARRWMLLPYIRRWLVIAGGSLVGIAPAEAFAVEAPPLIVLAAGFGITFSIAISVIACAVASYLLLGVRFPNRN